MSSVISPVTLTAEARPAIPPRQSFWRRLVGPVCRLRTRPDWERFAGPGWVERIMDMPVTDRFHAKQGRSVGRLRLPALAGGARPAYRLPQAPLQAPLVARTAGDALASRGLVAGLSGVGPSRMGPPAGRAGASCCRRRRVHRSSRRLQSFLAVEELTDMLPLHEAIPLAAQTWLQLFFAAGNEPW